MPLARRVCLIGLFRVYSLQRTRSQSLKCRKPGGAVVHEKHLGRTGALAACAGAAPLQGATRAEVVVKTDSISIQASNTVLRRKHRSCEGSDVTTSPDWASRLHVI